MRIGILTGGGDWGGLLDGGAGDDASKSTGTAAPAGTGTPITATDWSLDNWGSFLIANPRGGGIYYWDPAGGFQVALLDATHVRPELQRAVHRLVTRR